MYDHFEILSEGVRQYKRFNATGTKLTVRLKAPSDTDSITHLLTSVNELFQFALQDVGDGHMVGVTIRNDNNQTDGAIGISFRRKNQITGEVIGSVFEKVYQSNARFNALEKLMVELHSVRMPVGFGRVTIKGRPLSVMAHLKKV
jgi:hypothetical protein